MPHIHELIDWTVHVFIVHEQKVLLRRHDKYHHWLGVGGHIELDEDPITAAKREVQEEVGLPITIDGEADCKTYDYDLPNRDLPRPASMNIHHVTPTYQHIDLIYYATSPHTDVTPENQKDVWQWFTAEEITLHPDLRPEIKNHALEALEVFSITNQTKINIGRRVFT